MNGTTGTHSVPSQGPLLVIGAGTGRTGTNSLKLALEIIYGQPCYHMFEIFDKHKDHCQKWIEIDDQISKSPDGNVDEKLFKDIFHGYRCTVDFPTGAYYKQLMEAYPEAKVVLTERSPDSWVSSVRTTILSLPLFGDVNWLEYIALCQRFGWAFPAMRLRMWQRAFGFDVNLHDDAMLRRRFVERNERIKKTVPAERLLVYEVRRGWEPLCSFLGVPIPNQPFPNVNGRAVFREQAKLMRALCRIVTWSFRVALVVGFGVIIKYKCSNLISIF